jgi:glycosyltransferase involved in cell wall biosynthesis
MNNTRRILLIDFCNYNDYPIGGYLTFANNLKQAFGNELILVGITTETDDPVGKWFKKDINGSIYDYFAIARYSKAKTKHIIPDRIVIYGLLKYYRKEILSFDAKNVFIQRQEVLLAVQKYNFANICYRFAGLDNPLSISKYWFSHAVAKPFEKGFFKSLKKVNTILASGDGSAINEMIQRSKHLISRDDVIQFPTRINTDIFFTSDKMEARQHLGIDKSSTIILTSGRLAWFKGWKFMIDCFEAFLKRMPNSKLYFVGEGEDMSKIQNYINLKGLKELVYLVGRQRSEKVSMYLNASDLYIMGSYQEGWSTSLSEAVVCGIPSCVTNFHSSNEIVIEGKNGFVVAGHQVDPFVDGMINAINIPKPIYNQHIIAFASNRLKTDLLNAWPLI